MTANMDLILNRLVDDYAITDFEYDRTPFFSPVELLNARHTFALDVDECQASGDSASIPVTVRISNPTDKDPDSLQFEAFDIAYLIRDTTLVDGYAGRICPYPFS